MLAGCARVPSGHNRRASLVVSLVLCWAAALASGGELAAETAAKVDQRIAAFMDKNHVPGMSVAIVVAGQLVREGGYGLADLEQQVAAKPESVYRLASVSKMLTAVAALQLVEQGKLDLSAPVQRYVPEFPEKQAPINCLLLLKHQSGIRHYRGDEMLSAVAYRRVTDSLPIFQDDPLLFNPGERYSYTTYGFNLLGAAIEGASGQDYVEYVQQHVCRPAGMTTIRPDDPDQIIPHRAAGYRREGNGDEGRIVNDYPVNVSNKIPGGGWCSTAGDLGRFAIALMDERLLNRESLAQMWTAQPTTAGTPTGAGLGCFVELEDGRQYISHSGGQPKVSTFLVLLPERRAAVAMMCNLRGLKLNSLARQVLNLVVE